MDILKKVFQSITIPSVQGYDFEKDCVSTVGQWRIYNAKSKQKIGSVWICDQSKQFQTAKKEYTSLIKLKYPGILQVLEPLVEEKSYIAFVTERVECTLGQALNDNKFQLSDIETKLHLLEIVDGLQFLHSNVRQVHLDLQPDKVFFTENGKWKIGGSPFQQQILSNVVDCQTSTGFNILYSAPELLQTKPQCSYGTDIFSLGMLILRLMRFKNNRVSFPEVQDSEQQIKFIKQLDLLRFKDVFPESFLRFLNLMLGSQLQTRPTLQQFVQIEWFKDPYLITFNILNKLPEYDMQQQIVFFKGLSNVIFTFEKSILKKRLLPIVLGLTQYEHLLTPIVQIILETMRREDILSSAQFQSEIWPKLKQIISGKEIPAQVLYDIVLALPVFHKYIQQKEIQDHIIPLLIKCYECKVPKLQDLGIRMTEFVLENNDYTFSKTKILPRIFSLTIDANIEIRKTTLICIYKTLNVMDADQVLNNLDKVKQLGTDRQLNQIMLKIYQSLSKSLSSDQVSQKLLPQITPYLTDPTLSKQEFNEYFDTLQQMLQRIKSEKEKTLSDSNQNLISVDYKLSLPEPKRISDNKNEQFEFLNQFDQRLSAIPDKPTIQETTQPKPATTVNQEINIPNPNSTNNFQIQTQPQPIQQDMTFQNTIQIGQPIAIGTTINPSQSQQNLNTFNIGNDMFLPQQNQGFQMNTNNLFQQQNTYQNQQQSFTNLNNNFNTIPKQDSFIQNFADVNLNKVQFPNIVVPQTNNNIQELPQLQQQMQQQQKQQQLLQQQQQQQQLQQQQQQQQQQQLQQQQQQQQLQQQQQDQKKLSQRPLFTSNNTTNTTTNNQIYQKFENEQKSTSSDPWGAFNQVQQQQQDPWASFQNPVVQNTNSNVWGNQTMQTQNQNQTNQQQQQQLKNKYASFDDLI